jgi:fermentation-respiration switch protein FrsA (DUF1100 family)
VISREVSFTVDGLRLSGRVYLAADRAPRPAVCLCHGIPHGVKDTDTDVRDRGYPGLAERICREGFSVLIFNFRGTGASQGNFDIMGWTKDLGAALDYLTTLPEADGSELRLLGYSGGAAVAVYVAAHDERVSAVAACACPADFSVLASGGGGAAEVVAHFRKVGIIRDRDFPASAEEWLDSFRVVSPIAYVSRLSPRPLLLVHGSQDETVPLSHAQRIYAEAGEPKRLVIIDGVGHRLRQDERAVATASNWLKSPGGA